ncbi:MAG: dTMP kinase [Pseudomonadota bacterium]
MSEASPRGRFIAFEGGEGAGKSTQARMLAEALLDRGLAVTTTREPGGTPGAEALRSLLLDPPEAGWGPRAEALLFAAARADHVAGLIKPALAAGHWVICDRFVDSSRAYQGGAGGLGDDAITALHDFGSEGLRPDRTILLTVEENVARERLNARDGDTSDAIGGRSTAYHQAVAATFLALAKSNPEDFVVVNASGSPAAIHARVLSALGDLLEGDSQ